MKIICEDHTKNQKPIQASLILMKGWDDEPEYATVPWESELRDSKRSSHTVMFKSTLCSKLVLSLNMPLSCRGFNQNVSASLDSLVMETNKPHKDRLYRTVSRYQQEEILSM